MYIPISYISIDYLFYNNTYFIINLKNINKERTHVICASNGISYEGGICSLQRDSCRTGQVIKAIHVGNCT